MLHHCGIICGFATSIRNHVFSLFSGKNMGQSRSPQKQPTSLFYRSCRHGLSRKMKASRNTGCQCARRVIAFWFLVSWLHVTTHQDDVGGIRPWGETGRPEVLHNTSRGPGNFRTWFWGKPALKDYGGVMLVDIQLLQCPGCRYGHQGSCASSNLLRIYT